MNKLCLVCCTTDSLESAQSIAQQLVEAKLAACVQIVSNMISVYRWQDSIIQDTEYQLLIKTMTQHLDTAYKIVVQQHPYEVPEWIVLDVQTASQAYGDWVKQELNS